MFDYKHMNAAVIYHVHTTEFDFDSVRTAHIKGQSNRAVPSLANEAKLGAT